MKRIFLAFCAAVLLSMTVTGCNTMRGAGEDIEDAGDAVQDAVD